MKKFVRNLLLGSVVAMVLAAPAQLSAQSTNTAPSATNKPVKKESVAKGEKKRVIPFIGNLALVDKSAKTITVGKRTFQITSETKLFKAGKPATLEDAVQGERVTGAYRPDADGKLLATKVTFGAPAEGKKKTEKKDAPAQ